MLSRSEYSRKLYSNLWFIYNIISMKPTAWRLKHIYLLKKNFPLLAFLVNLIMKIAELENSKNRLLLLGWSESLKQKKKSKFYFLNFLQKNTSGESIAGEVSFKWSHHRH